MAAIPPLRAQRIMNMSGGSVGGNNAYAGVAQGAAQSLDRTVASKKNLIGDVLQAGQRVSNAIENFGTNLSNNLQAAADMKQKKADAEIQKRNDILRRVDVAATASKFNLEFQTQANSLKEQFQDDPEGYKDAVVKVGTKLKNDIMYKAKDFEVNADLAVLTTNAIENTALNADNWATQKRIANAGAKFKNTANNMAQDVGMIPQDDNELETYNAKLAEYQAFSDSVGHGIMSKEAKIGEDETNKKMMAEAFLASRLESRPEQVAQYLTQGHFKNLFAKDPDGLRRWNNLTESAQGTKTERIAHSRWQDLRGKVGKITGMAPGAVDFLSVNNAINEMKLAGEDPERIALLEESAAAMNDVKAKETGANPFAYNEVMGEFSKLKQISAEGIKTKKGMARGVINKNAAGSEDIFRRAVEIQRKATQYFREGMMDRKHYDIFMKKMVGPFARPASEAAQGAGRVASFFGMSTDHDLAERDMMDFADSIKLSSADKKATAKMDALEFFYDELDTFEKVRGVEPTKADYETFKANARLRTHYALYKSFGQEPPEGLMDAKGNKLVWGKQKGK